MNNEEDTEPKEIENQNTSLNKPNNELLQKGAIEVGGAIIGAIVGLALGGPTGAIIGATTPPVLSTTYNLLERTLQRRREKAQQIVEQAFLTAKVTPIEAIELLEADTNKADEFLKLLKTAVEADDSFKRILGVILGEILASSSDTKRERLLIISDAIHNLRSIHLHILKTLFEASGTLKAREISQAVEIPEIELRSVVRELELRGMIKDTGAHPVEWKLRELGNAIISFTIEKLGE